MLQGETSDPTPTMKTDVPILKEFKEPDQRLLELVKERAAPSINIVKTVVDPLSIKEIVGHRNKLRKALTKIDKGLTILQEENQLLKRILYRDSNKYRNDHGFKTMQLLKKSVDKSIENYPNTYLENLLEMLPQVISFPVYLPPASLAEHAGLRTWVAIHSLQRVIHCCHLIALHASCRVELQHEIHAAMLRLAISGRMWAVSNYTLKHMSLVMESLHGCSKSIPIGKNFYSEKNLERIFSSYVSKKTIVTLPSTLPQLSAIGEKISRSFMDEEKRRQESVLKSFNTSEKVPVSYRKEPIINSKASKKSSKESKEKNIAKTNEDIDLSNISNLKTLDDLKSFLDSETQLRKVNRKESVSRKFSQDQWKDLKKLVLSGFKPKLPNKSIKLSRKLLKEALSK